MSQSNESFDIEVSPPAERTAPAVNLASIGAASAAAPQPAEGEGVAVAKPPEPQPLVSGTVGVVLGTVSLVASLAAGFTSGYVQGALVVLALVAGLLVGKFAVEAPSFAAGKPLVQGPWLTLAALGATHLGNLATVLPTGLGAALATAGAALCCLLAGMPFSRPTRKA